MRSLSISPGGNWLPLIGVAKIVKGAFFVALGFGALHFAHGDLLSLVTRWMLDLRFDPEGRFVNFVLIHVADISPHKLRLISLGVFCYAAVDVLEGVGLVLERAWAEYLTLILSVSLLPWEFFEIARKPTWPKGLFTVVNVAVVLYLAAFLQRRQRERQAALQL